MEQLEVSHREIYDRLIAVEAKIDHIEKNTKEVVAAFDAAKGAFAVLEILGKIAKPLLWLAGGVTFVGVMWQNFRIK